MTERLEVSHVHFVKLGEEEVPFAKITREDGRPRSHHPRCPTQPGAPLASFEVCCDCIYGAIADREERARAESEIVRAIPTRWIVG